MGWHNARYTVFSLSSLQLKGIMADEFPSYLELCHCITHTAVKLSKHACFPLI